MRRLLLLLLTASLLCAAPAIAQIPADQDPDALPEEVVGVPTPTPDGSGEDGEIPDAAEEEDEGADDDPDGDGIEEEDGEEEQDPCETPDSVYSPDADYIYCVPVADNAGGGAGGGGSDEKGGPTKGRAPAAARIAAPQVVDLQRLPLTGSEPLAILLFGGGLLLGGAGLRVLLRTV